MINKNELGLCNGVYAKKPEIRYMQQNLFSLKLKRLLKNINNVY